MYKFHGGIKIADDRKLSNSLQIHSMPDPETLVIPLQQHLGIKPKLIVKVGDRVKKFQALTEFTNQTSLSSNIHAPTSGVITKIDFNPLIHPEHLRDICVFLQVDGKDETIPKATACQNQADILARIKSFGLVGLGGAGFPSYAKINKGIDYLIINAAECEPYISCDDGLIRNYPEQIVKGIEILQNLLNPKHILIGIENDKVEAIKTLQSVETKSIKVAVIPTIYPSGGEKQLIKLLTNQDFSKEKIADNTVCYNIGTAFSVYQVVILGEPLTQRLITLTGSACGQPGNYLIKIGTPLAHIIKHAKVKDCQSVISGGPLMGLEFDPSETSVKKTNNCFIFQKTKPNKPISECIRCGECAKVCPMFLLPQQLYWHSNNLKKSQVYNVNNCIECGCCDYVCPSNIPLAKIFVATKAEIKYQGQKRKKSDHAKVRNDNRAQRLIRLEQQRKTKLAKQRAEIKAKLSAKLEDTDKKTLIADAQKRANNK